MAQEPGGACGSPNGMGNCTFNYEKVGEISIDELEGIENYWAFLEAGGKEYVEDTDRGVDMSFWDDKSNATACARR
eukprot:14649327-Heterocapsa_arctica.AAC.1